MSNIMNDSKQFVDMKLKYSLNTVKSNFEKMKSRDEQSIKAFLEENFENVESEYLEEVPSDWKDSPQFLTTIKSHNLRVLASKLHGMWKDLSKIINPEIGKSDHYSLIYVPNVVIMPGGFLREYYYWDTYWIVLGLLVSGMYNTAKGMMDNFKQLILTYGYIPYGGRVYYLTRSQPPLFIPMIFEIYVHTQDENFVNEYLPIMEKELSYWESKKTSSTLGYDYFVYSSVIEGPRPENYKDDITNARHFKKDEKKNFYSEMNSVAESGWEYSSRWIINADGSNIGTQLDSKIRSIIPIDLNAIMCGNYRMLSEMYKQMGDTVNSKKYSEKYSEMKHALKVLWDEKAGIWLDYDMKNEKKRDYFYASNLIPLWARCYEKNETEIIVASVINYLSHHQITSYKGGVPTSLYDSGLEWDLPNSFPPIMHFIIVGINETRIPIAQHMAFAMARQWIKYNLKAFNKDQLMYEKYHAVNPGRKGIGFSFDIKGGFGWTNGALLDLIIKYRHIDFVSKSYRYESGLFP
ncbi:trehalase isoform X2 [Aethina tumida]|uniref:trehalase isoform X2 n=1 Tax=Aethina tumida TaxID=116153 RepID=UPI0021488A3D|nr:trehalase isoform X2 [Aethina tumida]